MATLVGGTFSRLHKGHRILLKTAIDTGGHVIIGLTTDDYAKGNKDYPPVPYQRRREALRRFMDRYSRDYEIVPLESRRGNSDTVAEYDCMVVSRETERSALDINRRRIANGLRALKIITIPSVLAEDLFPLSSSRIVSGEITPGGRRIKPVRISVSTRNDLKINAVKGYISTLMKNTSYRKFTGYDLPTEQPFGDDTAKLATQRAMKGLDDFDYSIGVESGIIYNPMNQAYFDFHYCSVIDREGRITVGVSSGFQVPENMVALVKRGRTESEAYLSLYGEADIGRSAGIVGKISGNRLSRGRLIEESVRNAFVPRFSPDHYPELFSPL